MNPRIKPEVPVIDTTVEYEVFGCNPDEQNESFGKIVWANGRWLFEDNGTFLLRGKTVQFVASKLQQLNRLSGSPND